jgi:hypothetical protein
MRIDVSAIRNVEEQESNREEVVKESGTGNSKEDKNPLLQLLGDYSDDETTATSKRGEHIAQTKDNFRNPNSRTEGNTPTTDSNATVETDIESFLQELEAVTGENLRPGVSSPLDSDSIVQNSAKESSDWRTCTDPTSGDCYYWNTSTGEVTWDNPLHAGACKAAEEKAKTIPEGVTTEPQFPSEQKAESSIKSISGADDDVTVLLNEHKANMVQQNVTTLIQQINTLLADLDCNIQNENNMRLKIQYETRISDWKEGGIRDDFMIQKLQKTFGELTALQKIEKVAASNIKQTAAVDLPVGWCKLLDRSGSQYYANVLTGETSWEWPPPVNGPAAIVYTAAPVRYAAPEADDLQQNEQPYEDVPTPPSEDHIAHPVPKQPPKRLKVSSAPFAKMNNLISKWQSANQELYVNDKSKIEDQVGKKSQTQQIEQWKLEQFKSGEANNNPNFQPIAVDWRERVQRAKQIRDGAKQ